MEEINIRDFLIKVIEESGSAIKAMQLDFFYEASVLTFRQGEVKIKCNSTEAEKNAELSKLNFLFIEEQRKDFLDFNVSGIIYLKDKSHIIVYCDMEYDYFYTELKYIKTKHIKQIEIPKELIK